MITINILRESFKMITRSAENLNLNYSALHPTLLVVFFYYYILVILAIVSKWKASSHNYAVYGHSITNFQYVQNLQVTSN